MPQRQEIPTNTAEQVEEYLRAALDLVERLEVPDDLRVVAFGQAVTLTANKQVLLVDDSPIAVRGLGGRNLH